MIDRNRYIEELFAFKDKQLIKVVTGIRRCGKSTLLKIYQDALKKQGVPDQNIINLNLESEEGYDVENFKDLFKYVSDRLSPVGKNYVFLDEVQQVPNFQRACDSLFIKENIDLYITGSNAGLLSGELATLLSGRYVEIKMLPLSFEEYISAVGCDELARKYTAYVTGSAFPYVLQLKSSKDIHTYLDGIFSSVVLKDIIARKRISDVYSLEKVIRFMFDNIGNLTSVSKITNTLKSQGQIMSVHTVGNYINALCESFVMYKASRYDIKGKQYLICGEKYYLCDVGLRYYLLGNKPADLGHILENVVYLELLRRGYEVYVGKLGDVEVDFIAIKNGITEYYQVALTLRGENILQRELKPLDSIDDHNAKFLLTLDYDPEASHNGIRQINALDWLLMKS